MKNPFKEITLETIVDVVIVIAIVTAFAVTVYAAYDYIELFY